MCEDVVGYQQIRRPLGCEVDGNLSTEETHLRRHAFRDRDFCDVGGWLHAEHRYAELLEVPKEITVVRRDLDHEAVGAEPKPLTCVRGKAGRVVEPSRRVRREV